jgi:hypothetical protein
MIDASWVISDKVTGQAVRETRDFERLQFIDLRKHKVWTVVDWLANVQRAVNANEGWVKG